MAKPAVPRATAASSRVAWRFPLSVRQARRFAPMLRAQLAGRSPAPRPERAGGDVPVAGRLVAGNAWINAHNLFPHGVPYAGVNKSGMGGGVLSTDTLLDYQDGVDRLDISSLGIGFGDLRIVDSGANVLVFYDESDPADRGLVVITGHSASDMDSSDFIFALGTVLVAHPCQHLGVAFSSDNGPNDAHASDARDIADYLC